MLPSLDPELNLVVDDRVGTKPLYKLVVSLPDGEVGPQPLRRRDGVTSPPPPSRSQVTRS